MKLKWPTSLTHKDNKHGLRLRARLIDVDSTTKLCELWKTKLRAARVGDLQDRKVEGDTYVRLRIGMALLTPGR